MAIPLIQYSNLTFAGTIYLCNDYKTKFLASRRGQGYENHSAFRRDLHH